MIKKEKKKKCADKSVRLSDPISSRIDSFFQGALLCIQPGLFKVFIEGRDDFESGSKCQVRRWVTRRYIRGAQMSSWVCL